MARLGEPITLPEPDWSLRDYTSSPDTVAFNALQATSDALPLGQITGFICRWQRGDGYAYYLVTSERPLTLRRIAYMDDWSVEDALIRGLQSEDVLAMQERQIRFRALFGKS